MRRRPHGNPFDGHTLGPAAADIEANTGIAVQRIHVDKGYRGHNHPNKFKVWISGRVRGATAALKREMKRRAAIEPVIGHIKAEHRMDRNYLKARNGDRINAALAAAGYNFSLLLRWLAALLRVLIAMLDRAPQPPKPAKIREFPSSSRTTSEVSPLARRPLRPVHVQPRLS
jgi:transposase, IS5 family